MSTRGGVAVGTPKKWVGVYNRHDSYPSELGTKVLIYLIGVIRGQNENLKTLEDYKNRLLKFDNWRAFQTGDHSLDDRPTGRKLWHISNKRSNPTFLEWVYVLEEPKAILWILQSVETKRMKTLELNKQKIKIPISTWKPIAKIYLRLLVKVPLAKMTEAQIVDYVEEMVEQIQTITIGQRIKLPLRYPTDGERKYADN